MTRKEVKGLMPIMQAFIEGLQEKFPNKNYKDN